MQRTDLLDTDGENKAIRSFLRFYLKPGITIGEMRDNMESSGWDGCWPDSIGAADWNSTLTKFEAQDWLRHLFSLEQPAVPTSSDLEVRAGQMPDYARDQAGAGAVDVDARFERELEMVRNNPAIKVIGRLAAKDDWALASGLLQEPVLDAAAAAVEASAQVWTGFARNDARTCVRAAVEAAAGIPLPVPTPIPMQLVCPECGAEHVDEGEWATRLHKTHQCQACKHEWRPYEYPTVGVAAQVEPAITSVATRIAASGGEIVKLLGFVEARAGQSVETEGIHQQVAYINRVLTELSPGEAGGQGTESSKAAVASVIMPRNVSEKALLLMAGTVRAGLCKLTGCDGHVVKMVFDALYAHLAAHDHEGPALGTAEHVLLPVDLDDDLWRAGITAFRTALNQRTGLDLFVAKQTYQGMYNCLAARRQNPN